MYALLLCAPASVLGEIGSAYEFHSFFWGVLVGDAAFGRRGLLLFVCEF